MSSYEDERFDLKVSTFKEMILKAARGEDKLKDIRKRIGFSDGWITREIELVFGKSFNELKREYKIY